MTVIKFECACNMHMMKSIVSYAESVHQSVTVTYGRVPDDSRTLNSLCVADDSNNFHCTD